MGSKRKLIYIVGIELCLTIIISIGLPKLFVENNIWLFQSVLFLVISSTIIRFHYLKLNGYLYDLIKKYDLTAQINDQDDIMSKIHLIKNNFDVSQVTAKRYKEINNTLNIAIEVNNAILNYDTTQEIYDLILAKALEAISKCEKGSIMLLNDQGDLEFISLIGFSDSFYNIRIPKEEAFLYKLTDGKLDKTIIVEDVVAFNKKYMSEEEFDQFYSKFPKTHQTAMSVPIRYDDVFLGVINLDSDTTNGFDDEDLAIMVLFASQLEVTIRNRNLLDKILYLSRYDKLTDAYNRSYFEEIIEQLIESENVFAFVVIDIDNLKGVNDEYGHLEGDRLLTIFASMVKKNIRGADHFARIGGDEFVLIFDKLNKIAISKIFMRIMQELESYTLEENIPYNITFSYGITMYPDEAQSSDDLYIKSDEKMYKMKRAYKEKK